MASSPRERALKRAKLMKRLVEQLDAVRALKLFNTADALRAMSELSLSGDPWSELRSALTEIAKIPQREPFFAKIRRFDKVSNTLLWISLAFSISSLLMLSILHLEGSLAVLLMIAALVLLNIAYTLKLYVLTKLRWIYASRSSEIRGKDDLFRRSADQLLARMRGELRKAGVDPSTVTFKLYFDDYSQLRVVGKGRGFYRLTFR
ncbi:MAG: hypothetical protein QXQ60_00040 [Thermofilum sp.]